MSRFIRSALVVAAALSLSTGFVACDKKGKDEAKKEAVKAGDKVAEGAKKAGDKVAEGAEKVAGKAAEGADKAAEGAEKAADKVAKGAEKVADKAAEGAGKAAEGAEKAGDKAAEGAEKAADKVAEGAEKAADKVADAAGKVAEGAVKAAAGAEAAKPAADAKATFVKFEIDHTDKAKGLVKGEFKKFAVKDVVVDLKDLTKSKATLEVDISSISTGIDKRDGHLKSGDFFDVAKFATATVMISKVGAEKDGMHPAEAKFSLHGVEKTFPVMFKIVEKKDDGSIVVEGEVGLKRLDYKVGGPPEKAGAVDDTKVMVRLHLK